MKRKRAQEVKLLLTLKLLGRKLTFFQLGAPF